MSCDEISEIMDIHVQSARNLLFRSIEKIRKGVPSFLESLAQTKKKKDKDFIMMVYKEATIHCPRFNDMDKDLILSYYNNDNFLTQFSLDCDWEKAQQEVDNVKQAAQ